MASRKATEARHRYVALDSLRGICACMVVLYHFHTTGRISNLPLLRNSYLFVDFFFVLSGFVITTSYRHRIAESFPIRRFMWLRFWRIYPLHLFMLAMFLLVQIAALITQGSDKAFQHGMSLYELFASLTLTQTFILPQKIVWNVPSWSIAVEMWTYFAFAVAFRFLRHTWALIGGAIVVAVASFSFIMATQPHFIDADGWSAFFRCTYGFGLGVIGAELFGPKSATDVSPDPLSTVLEGIGLIVTVLGVSIVGFGPLNMAAPPLFLAVIWIFAQQRGLLSKFLSSSFPVFIGTLSYSIYMVHYFIIYRVGTALGVARKLFHRDVDVLCLSSGPCSATGSPWAGDALLVPLLIVVVAASWCTWRLIELPFQQWSKKTLAGRGEERQPSADEQEAPAF